MRHPFAWPFRRGRRGVPRLRRVTDPIDLGMIERCEEQPYEDADEFYADLKRVWANCYTHNSEETHVHKMAQTLEQMAHDLFTNLDRTVAAQARATGGENAQVKAMQKQMAEMKKMMAMQADAAAAAGDAAAAAARAADRLPVADPPPGRRAWPHRGVLDARDGSSRAARLGAVAEVASGRDDEGGRTDSRCRLRVASRPPRTSSAHTSAGIEHQLCRRRAPRPALPPLSREPGPRPDGAHCA